MSSALDPRTPTSDYDRIALELKGLEDRLAILEAPSGTSLFKAVAKLELLVADIQAQLDIYNASRYTNAQINARIAAPPSSVAVTGDISATGNLSTSGYLFTPAGYNYDITYTRRTAWLGNDGRLGYASSSVDGKAAVRPADIDGDAVLDALKVREFRYRREIARRTSLRINEGIDYVPAVERGLLAHEVDEVLPWLVYHGDDGKAEGVEYSMLTVALLAIAQQEREARRALEARVAKLEGGAS